MELAFSIPVPNWSGICLGMVIQTVVLLALGLYWGRKKPKEIEGIPFDVIEGLESGKTGGAVNYPNPN